jgi:hypothetical protein
MNVDVLLFARLEGGDKRTHGLASLVQACQWRIDTAGILITAGG